MTTAKTDEAQKAWCASQLQIFNENGDQEILRNLLSRFEWSSITPPFFCDYGCHISMGHGCYVNRSCTFSDKDSISIGEHVLFGPNVRVLTEGSPSGVSPSGPVKIDDNCWICGGVTICPGVTIGQGAVIGAGAVVTQDVPPNSLVRGNPAVVAKTIRQDTAELNRDTFIPFNNGNTIGVKRTGANDNPHVEISRIDMVPPFFGHRGNSENGHALSKGEGECILNHKIKHSP